MVFKLTCSASDCNKSFKSIMSHAKYCSDRCRWRHSKRKQVKERDESGLCKQCGNEMITPIAIYKKKPDYCKSCQESFQDLYFKKKEDSTNQIK